MLFFSLPRKFDILSVFLSRSVAQLCLTLCDPTDCNTPGLPVPRPHLKFAQVHFHCVSDAIQPSYPLTPSSCALNLSQHQGLFQWVSCSHQVTKALPMSIQGWSPLRLTSLISLLSRGLSGVFSSTTVQRHQFFGAQPSLWSSSHNRT